MILRVPTPDEEVGGHAVEEVGGVGDEHDAEGETSGPAFLMTGTGVHG